jgi:hypothetical protein
VQKLCTARSFAKHARDFASGPRLRRGPRPLNGSTSSGRPRFSFAGALRKTCARNAAQTTLLSSTTDFRKSGKPRSRPRHREDYNSPEKFRMECVLEKPVAPLLPSPPPAGQFLSAMLAAELVLWSWRRDSNPRPSDYKSDALPTELRQQLGKGASPRKLIPRIPSRCPGQLYKVPQLEVGVQRWAGRVLFWRVKAQTIRSLKVLQRVRPDRLPQACGKWLSSLPACS